VLNNAGDWEFFAWLHNVVRTIFGESMIVSRQRDLEAHHTFRHHSKTFYATPARGAYKLSRKTLGTIDVSNRVQLITPLDAT
jgi:hypothetical protein